MSDVSNEDKLKVLKYLYPDCPRSIVDGNVVVGTEDGTEDTLEVDLTTIDFNTELLNIEIEELRFIKNKEIETERDKRIENGMPYTFNGVDDIVQTREKDKVILLGLAMKAQRLMGQTTEPVINFRSGNNNDYLLTPMEAIELTSHASAFVEGVYATSWYYKDLIKNTSFINGLENLAWVD